MRSGKTLQFETQLRPRQTVGALQRSIQGLAHDLRFTYHVQITLLDAMALVQHQFHTDGIALLSYLIGDDSTGEAALIDPRPDPEIYLEKARQLGVSITHILETHIHADFMSGSRELALQSPGARIYLSAEGEADYDFEHSSLHDGDQIALGDVVLTVRHTPGHTPEHISFEAAEKGHEDTPWGVFTGDSLFVGSAGRPDLLGSDEARKLAGQLYETLYEYFRDLSDEVIVLPGHGAGSPCGADIGARMMSSIGYEKRTNQFLQFKGKREDFVEFALDAPDEPTYYQRMKKLNASGPEPTHGLPRVEGMNPERFSEAIERTPESIQVLDTRSLFSFGGGHIPGSINIWAKPMLSLWAGWMIDPDREIYLVLDNDTDLKRIVRLLIRVGLTRFGGYLVGGLNAWATAGKPIQTLTQVPVHELRDMVGKNGSGPQILDVRSEEEYQNGSIEGARHLFVPEVPDEATEILDKTKPVITYCGSGYRASIAASVLQSRGFEDVRNVPGSWQAWKKIAR